jgi:hypothetical protein
MTCAVPSRRGVVECSLMNRLQLRGTAYLSAGARPFPMLALAAGARIRLK